MRAPFGMTRVHVADLRSIRNIKIAWLIRAIELSPARGSRNALRA
jgi:hypothetical protein